MGRRSNNNFSKPKDTKSVLKRLLKYIFDEKKIFFVFLITIIICSVSVFVPSMITAPLVDALISAKSLSVSVISVLKKYILLLAIIHIIGVATTYLYNLLALKLSQKTVNRIRKDLFAKLEYLPIRYFDSVPHGEIMSRFTNDMDNISDALNDSLPQFVSGIITLVGTFSAMIYLSPLLAFITCLIFPIMFKASSFIINTSRESFRSQQKNLGELNSFVEETMEGQKVVKAFCYEENIKKKFDVYNKNYCDAATKAQIYSGIVFPLIMNINNINYAVSTTIGAVLILFKWLTIGRLTSFLQLARQFGRPVSELSNQLTMLQSALAGAERVFDLMDQGIEEQNSESGLLIDKSCDVKFDNVVFGYTPEKIVLDGVSFYAKPNQKIALVGSTGAGKTTIANLITRFYDINQGSITINNKDIKNFSLKNLRSSLGVVLQDTHLFEGTVIDNIRYGRLDATDQECIDAAKLSNAHSFIKHLPDGYQTVLSDDGQNLSQGQRQMLNIARVAVSKPAILILDEATSSVDTRTEQLIQDGMDKLMDGRTTFVIAHRLSTIRNANAILVIENGKIIERGDHDNLIKQKGRYWQLCTGQCELD